MTEARLVIEIGGRRAHSDPRRFTAERERQNRLILAGSSILRYTWQQLVTDPAGVAAQMGRKPEELRIHRAK